MKIGRNDPCPCGSGKKYKNCCIDKPLDNPSEVNTVSIEDSISDYKYIEATSSELQKIISVYNVDDVTKAIFCINSWVGNRSALSQTLTINHSLCNIARFGNKSIKEYKELKLFFNEIKPYLQITHREDLTLNDFGEVKIIVDDEVFPVILGTGHEQAFAVMNYLPTLANIINKTEDLRIVLNYNRTIINSLADKNIVPENKITFELPKEQFWYSVNSLFKSKEFLEHREKVLPIMGYQKCPIEMRHFFNYSVNSYPLYNSSIVIDFYKLLLSLSTKNEYNEHINLTIGRLIEDSFNFSDSTLSRVLIAPTIVNLEKDKPHTGNHLTFLTITSGEVLIGINKGDFNDFNRVEAEINLIDDLHKRNQLRFGEMFYRKELHGGYACDVAADMPIHYVLIEPFTDITAHGLFLGGAKDQFTCTALDMLYMLGFMKDFDELLDFIKYDKTEKAELMIIGGKSNHFFTWKNAHHQIASGAIEYNYISIPYGEADGYVYEYYTNNLINFPFSFHSKMFNNLLNWDVRSGPFGYSIFDRRGCYGFGGEGKMIGGSTFIFLSHNVELFNKEDFDDLDNHSAIKVIDELNQRLFNKYGEMLGTFQLLKEKVLQLLYMPMHYAKEVDYSGFTSDSNKKYVFSDVRIDSDIIIVRYTVKLKELLSAITNTSNKSVESAYFLELIDPLKKHLQPAFSILEEKVNNDSVLKKEVDVFTVELEYYYNGTGPHIEMKKLNFKHARKEIAKVCYASGVKPGEYHGKAATQTIRKMQQSIIKVFEEKISQYSLGHMHKLASNYYSTQLHEIIINLKRYRSFNNLEPSIEKEFKESTRRTREEKRRNLRTAQYLLESNLTIQHKNKTYECKIEEFEGLLAFADWLVVLQDNSDNCHHTDFDVYFIIDDEYKVDTVINGQSEIQYDDILLRKYSHSDYSLKNDETDKSFLIQCGKAFSADTGLELDIFLSIIEYFQLDLTRNPFAQEIYPNVFEISKDALINDFVDSLVEKRESDVINAEKALDFITLNSQKLKYLNGKMEEILPVWEREKRNNRFDVKPIIVIEGKCIFSPVVMHQLTTMWRSGFLEWYLPFEIGLETVMVEISNWKKRYEDEMVQDIAKAFSAKGFDPVLPEIQLDSRYPKHDFPDDLGDYDVFAINKTRKEIWLIESKVINKVGSIFEDQMQQKGFFNDHRYDEKFQKRIDYIKNNTYKVLSALGLELEGYTIIAYMVTNKLFVSRYKAINFPIITYHELLATLESYEVNT